MFSGREVHIGQIGSMHERNLTDANNPPTCMVKLNRVQAKEYSKCLAKDF